MLLHNLICWRAVHPLGGKKLKVSGKPAHLSISFFFLSLSLFLSDPVYPPLAKSDVNPLAHWVPKRVYSFCFDTRS